MAKTGLKWTKTYLGTQGTKEEGRKACFLRLSGMECDAGTTFTVSVVLHSVFATYKELWLHLDR